MEKVDEKWLKAHGWQCTLDDTYETDKTTFGKTVTHRVVYDFVNGEHQGNDYKHASWAHTYSKYYELGYVTGKETQVGTSNFYEFCAMGNGFTVKNKIAYRKFTDEQIESALKVCGIE